MPHNKTIFEKTEIKIRKQNKWDWHKCIEEYGKK